MSTIAHRAEAPGHRLLRHWRMLWPLAWPVVLSRAGLVVMAMADVVMVGRYDTEALGALALGYAVMMPLMVAGIGCTVGVVAIAARGHGSATPGLAATALRGLHWATLVGGIAALLTLTAGPVLRTIGQTPELASGGAAVAWMSAPGVLLQIVFTAASFYLEGTGRARPGLVAMAGANIVNLGLNWLLIGGHLGFPELGAPGAALASTLARAVMVAGLLVWMLRLPEFAPFRGRLQLWGPGGWPAGAEMRRIGLAGGAAYFFETVAFAAMAQAAGLLGASALAAYTILHNVETTVFMIALGISVASAVRIGQAAGAGDREEARSAGLAGLAAAMGLVAHPRPRPARRRTDRGRLLQRRSVADRPRRADHRDPRLLDGLRRRAGDARPGQPRARRQLGHHPLLLPRLLGRHGSRQPPARLHHPPRRSRPLPRHRRRLHHRGRPPRDPLPPPPRPALMARRRSPVLSFLAWLPQAALLGLARALPPRARLGFAAGFARLLVALVPDMRRRVEGNLALIFPDMTAAERRRIRNASAGSFGRTMIEVMTRRDFQARADWTGPTGPGLAALMEARAAGKGAILVSGHFGQWEAVRASLAAIGIESGALYRPVKNPRLERDYLANIQAGGMPVLGRDSSGVRQLVRTLRGGGVMAILLDQYTKGGAPIDFLGHPAPTGTVIAELALKYGLPMIPVYGTRGPDGVHVTVDFEAPIPPTTALAMTQAAADSLAARIRADPEQYFWLHRRWVKRF